MTAMYDSIYAPQADFKADANVQILVTMPVKANSKQRGKNAALEMLSFTTGVYQLSRWIPGVVKSKKIIAPECEEYLFVRPPDQASAELKTHCILGNVLPEISIEVYTVIGDDKPAVTYTLLEAIVTHCRLRIAPGGNPLEYLGLASRITKWSYAGPNGIPSQGGFDWLERKVIK